ncbi:MAG TPA: hypothetical protein VEW65_14905, partial [Chryseolinea sp.]|nr:hypothetical protein [Chryseolinea sp.]
MSSIIDGPDMHYLYLTLPCEIRGSAKIDGVRYEMIINAGSYIALYNSDHRIYVGCSADSCRRFFIEQGGNSDRDIPDEHE